MARRAALAPWRPAAPAPAAGPASARPATVQSGTSDWPHTTRVLPWALAGFLGMLWLVPFEGIQIPVQLPLDAKLDRPMLAALAALWLAGMAAVAGPARPRVRASWLHGAVALFLITALVSILVNAGGLANLGELQLAVKKLALLASYLVFFVVVASVVRPSEAPRFAMLALALAALTAVGAVFEYRSDLNVFYDWSARLVPGAVVVPPDLVGIDYVGRHTVYGPTGHPLALAAMLTLALPFALVGALRSEPGFSRPLCVVAAALLLAGIVATERKTGVIACGAAALVLLAYRPPDARRLVGLGLGLALMMHLLAPGAMGSLRQQLAPDRLVGVLSTRDRQSDYDAVRPDVIAHSVLGRGYQTYDPLKYRILDNEYLGALVGTGVVGLAAFVGLMLAAGMTGHAVTRRTRDTMRTACARAGVAAVAAFAVSAALFDVLSFPHVTYMFFFVAGLIAVCATPDEARPD